MSHLRKDQIEAFADSTLQVIHETELLSMYKVLPPKRFHWCYVIFTPVGIVIGGDQGFGELPGHQAISRPTGDIDQGVIWFADPTMEEEYLGEKFFGRKPTGPQALRKWSNDVGWLAAVQKEFSRLYVKKMDEDDQKARKPHGTR